MRVNGVPFLVFFLFLQDHEGVMVAPRHGLLAEMEMKYEAFCRTACKWAAWCSCTFNVFGGAFFLLYFTWDMNQRRMV